MSTILFACARAARARRALPAGSTSLFFTCHCILPAHVARCHAILPGPRANTASPAWHTLPRCRHFPAAPPNPYAAVPGRSSPPAATRYKTISATADVCAGAVLPLAWHGLPGGALALYLLGSLPAGWTLALSGCNRRCLAGNHGDIDLWYVSRLRGASGIVFSVRFNILPPNAHHAVFIHRIVSILRTNLVLPVMPFPPLCVWPPRTFRPRTRRPTFPLRGAPPWDFEPAYHSMLTVTCPHGWVPRRAGPGPTFHPVRGRCHVLAFSLSRGMPGRPGHAARPCSPPGMPHLRVPATYHATPTARLLLRSWRATFTAPLRTLSYRCLRCKRAFTMPLRAHAEFTVPPPLSLRVVYDLPHTRCAVSILL